MKLVKALCCMFLLAFFSLDRAQLKHNSCLLRTEELTNSNVLVT